MNEIASSGVDQAAQTKEIKTPVVQKVRPPWRRQVLCALLLLLVGFVLGAIAFYYVLTKLPNFRKYMFDEQSEVSVKTVTETEKNVLWTFVFMPVISLVYTICEGIGAFVFKYTPLWLCTRIAKWCSISFILEKLRKKVVSLAILTPLKTRAIKCAKLVFKRMALLACAMLLLYALSRVLEHYKFWTRVEEVMCCMRGAMSSGSFI
jgi:hypothetical protein